MEFSAMEGKMDVVFEDVRRLTLGLLFVVAFGWMAAELVPGAADSAWPQQVAATSAR